MAGGNETPRQKMIGMMYLVLTALLALNVSSAILQKFAIVNTTLEDLVVEDKDKAERKLEAIEKSTSSDPKVLDAIERAKKVRALTKDMVTYLDGVKVKIKVGSGNKALEGEELVLNLNNPEEVMLNNNKPEVGLEYQKRLKGYVKDLNDLMKLKVPFPKLDKKAEDFAEFKNDPHQNKKNFLEFSFEGTPGMAGIAMLSQMQTEVLEYEAAALDSLNVITKGVVFEVDQMVPMVQAESNSIVAGNSYEGSLFLAGSASGITPEMFKDGQKLQVEDKDVGLSSKVKMGKIKFTASASNYNANGIAESQFKVKINLNVPGKQPYENIVKYKVIKPTAVFASAAAATLYRDAGTEVNVTVPSLSDLSSLDLTVPADQGKVYKIAPGKFAILPTRAQCNVNVLINGAVIQTQKFETRDVPMPIYKVMMGSTTLDVAKGIPAGTQTVRVEPEIIDDIFAKNNNKDNKYYITSMVLQIDGGSPIALKSGTISLGQYNLRKGQSISVSQVQVNRPTYDGSTKTVNGSKMSFACRIN